MTEEQKNVNRLKRALANLGNMIPGSLSEQWNVCGNPKCKCKDPEKPVKHGPYYQLSFSIKGKSSSFFIKKEDVPEVKRRIKRYKRFKELCVEITRAYVDLARKEGFRKETE